jgi:hypothetical protein
LEIPASGVVEPIGLEPGPFACLYQVEQREVKHVGRQLG